MSEYRIPVRLYIMVTVVTWSLKIHLKPIVIVEASKKRFTFVPKILDVHWIEVKRDVQHVQMMMKIQ